MVPINRLCGKHRLQELVKRIPKGYQGEEMDWGGPVGNEVW